MKRDDLTLPKFDFPREADAPSISPDVYFRWVWQNVERLRDSGELDRLCAARALVKQRFTFSERDSSHPEQ